MNPSVLSAFSRLTENATDDEKLIEEITELKYSDCKTSLGLDEEKLSGYPKALRRRILMKFLSENIKKIYPQFTYMMPKIRWVRLKA